MSVGISLDIFVYLKNTYLEISVDISNICDIHGYLVIYLECIQSQMIIELHESRTGSE